MSKHICLDRSYAVDLPLISVVTVVFNGEKQLEKTMLNILGQNYPNVEYIVIDGGSTDGTLDIIKKYKDRISYWISEKDNGIYDAMNKGVRLATGEWIIFINAGDAFYDQNVLSEIFAKKVGNEEIIYGDAEIVYPNFSRIRTTGGLDKIWWKGMPFSHQSCLAKRSLLLEHPFNAKYKIAADYEFVCWAKKSGKKISGSKVIVASVSSLGLSDVKRDQVLMEFNEISSRYYDADKARKYFYIKRLQNNSASFFKGLFPKWLIQFITRIKYLSFCSYFRTRG